MADVQATCPRVAFLLGGVQKAGTTALARHLDDHPDLALPRGKEAHVFDAPDFNDAWSPAEVDGKFAPHFDNCERMPGGKHAGCENKLRLHGDATPISVFHPTLVARVARYNPSMRWVILLRDPVERAISHYFMERESGHEQRGLLPAVLLERARLREHWDDWAPGSPLRVSSYVARGRYARQLDVLLAHFPREQVLCLRSADLAAKPGASVGQVLAFLGVAPTLQPVRQARVFAGQYQPPPPWSPGRLALRFLLRNENASLGRLHGIDLEA